MSAQLPESPWIKLDPADDAIIKEIERERDRGAALIAAALVDERLFETLKLRLRQEKTKDDKNSHGLLFRRNGGLSGHFPRIHLGFLLQLYPHEILEILESVNEIRNKFAHKTSPITFRTKEIKDICAWMMVRLVRATMAGDLFLRTATSIVRNPRPRSFTVPGNLFTVSVYDPKGISARRIFMQCVKVLLFELAWARDVYANEFVQVSPPPLPGTPVQRSQKETPRRKVPGTGRPRQRRSSRQ